MNIYDEVTALINATLLHVRAKKQKRQNACAVYKSLIDLSLDRLSLKRKEDIEMLVYMNSRAAAREYSRKFQKPVVDKGTSAPEGRRWAVRLY